MHADILANLVCRGIRSVRPRRSIDTVQSFLQSERGTVRGMHYQVAPHEEAKLVRVTRGAVFDVAADIRPASATYGEWVAVELSAENHVALFIPAGCAHGLQTLVDHTEVLYQISTPFVASAARGCAG